jgi:hypothetical protein
MNADFRKGWRAACAAVAKGLRNDAPRYADFDPVVGELLRDLAGEIEEMPPPKTMTVVDENGGRLL